MTATKRAASKLFRSLGDSAKGRPTLGSTVSVELFRVFRLFGMMEGINSVIGDASTLVYTCGKNAGSEFGGSILIRDGKEDIVKYLKAVSTFSEELGFGILSVLDIDLEKHFVLLELDECVTCSGIQNIGKKICHFESGFFAGVLEVFVGKVCEAKEIKCCADGDESCNFEVIIKKESMLAY